LVRDLSMGGPEAARRTAHAKQSREDSARRSAGASSWTTMTMERDHQPLFIQTSRNAFNTTVADAFRWTIRARGRTMSGGRSVRGIPHGCACNKLRV
jgi:hypothetical protein